MTVSITNKSIEWTQSKSLSDAQICECGKGILSVSTDNYNGEELYTKEQMIDMFRLGYEMRNKKDMSNEEIRKLMKPYSLIRGLGVGESMTFPYERWKSVRIAASQIKKQFGCSFHVSKLAPSREVGDIKVIRLD